MSQDGIFSSRCFNMSGLELDEKGKIKDKGQIFYGADFVLKNSVFESNKAGDYMLIIQSVRNGEQTKNKMLKAKTERSARIEINKINSMYKHQKPRFINRDQYLAKLKDQKEKAGGIHN
jgi:hypothetical protein